MQYIENGDIIYPLLSLSGFTYYAIAHIMAQIMAQQLTKQS